ncbi:D-alanyl-D-alanine carboxypeptidase/D-alanyl-D-alanine-endopeptidase [Holophaga foetida]|uniref:D-alanyl-D-alanine carboxypeptidase/D-alanyl-D-alanine-endopeptidase n=1 Tax=Holophaga foetida TaxID=35839 RepID=UPI00024732F9|nr:D-alanyl-D-alanine carboxypeptidase [Holophaga foetida]
MHLKKGLLATLLFALPLPAADFSTWLAAMQTRNIQVSAGLWDLSTGKLLEGHQTELSLIPASTTKVVSTYAMLKTWKPDTVLETELFGDLKEGVILGDLIVKGHGDPSLVSERIWMLAQDLKNQGVQRIKGRIRSDQSAFDSQMYGFGWENTSSSTTPPILPLSVNFNRAEGRLVQDPDARAVEVFTRIFREAGLVVEEGPVPAGELRRLAGTSSAPLRRLVQDVNKISNNFMVEMLVKSFGEGTWPRGIGRIQGFYQSALGLGPDKIAITDGSGLSKENHLSARTLAIVLRAAWHDFEVGPEFVDSLKVIGGEPWALRAKYPNLNRRIRCKTGHLQNVVSVCGYMQRMDGQLRVFAIILNGEAYDYDVWDLVSHWAN